MTQRLFNPRKQSFEKYFWSFVDKKGPDECWLWRLGPTSREYAMTVDCRKNSPTKGKSIGVHRIAYELTCGPLKNNCCHTCDTPLCCNPIHLWDGTQKENVQDCWAKGRGKITPPRLKGEASPRAHLTLKTVKLMKDMYALGFRPKEIHLQLGVPYSTMTGIIYGPNWKHVEHSRSI